MCPTSRYNFEKYLAWRKLSTPEQLYVPNKSNPYILPRHRTFFLLTCFSCNDDRKIGTRKNRQTPTRSNSRNITITLSNNVFAGDIIAYYVQFTNGPCIQDDSSLAAFMHSSGNSYTIINPVRYYDADDGLLWPCPGNDSSLSTVRHDLSRLTITHWALSAVIQWSLTMILACTTCQWHMHSENDTKSDFFLYSIIPRSQSEINSSK